MNLLPVEMEEEFQDSPQEMSESEIMQAVDQEIRWASQKLQDDLTANRTNAWGYFKGELPQVIDDDISEHFQTIVSRDVENTIESTLAEILPAFASDRPAEFDPVGPGDEDQAAVESDICNDVLMEAGSGYLELTTAAKNALLLRIGALEIWWDDQEDVTYHEVDNINQLALVQLSQDPANDIRELKREVVATPQGIAQALSVQVRRREKRGKCRVEAVPVDELLISSDCVSMDLDRARFVGRQTLVSRSDLIAQGFDPAIIDTISPYTTTTNSTDRSARERNTWGREKHAGDRAMDMLMVVRCYYRLDEDRDGIAERRRILVAGAPGGWTLLDDEPVDYQPFAVGAAYIWPHQPYGISLYDKLKQIQDLKTKFWRILLEAGQRASRDRVQLPPGIDLDDWMDIQFGGGIRGNGTGKIEPVPNQHFPSEVSVLLDIADKARREGGGGAVDKSNRESMPVEAGAHGVERMLSAIEELNSMAARMLAETIVRQSYIKIHHVLRTNGGQTMTKSGGQWIQVDPTQWRPRDKVGISVGLTVSERNRIAQALSMTIQDQKELMDKGSTLVNPTVLYRAEADRLRMMGVQHPQSYFIDPQSQEGQQAAQQAQQAAQQQQQAAQQAQQQQAALVMGLEQMRAEVAQMREISRQQIEMAKLQQKSQSDRADRIEDARQSDKQTSVDLTKLEVENDQNVPGALT